MPLRILVLVLLIITMHGGCRQDAAATSASSGRSTASAPPAAASNEVTLRIRKLGGADGIQVTNRLTVTTPIGDDFTVTEQVGGTQLQFRGKVTALPNGKFRIPCEYSETSADGQKRIKSTIEAAPDTETELGGLLAAEGMERLTLTVSRP